MSKDVKKDTVVKSISDMTVQERIAEADPKISKILKDYELGLVTKQLIQFADARIVENEEK